jgi:hypothetical protein
VRSCGSGPDRKRNAELFNKGLYLLLCGFVVSGGSNDYDSALSIAVLDTPVIISRRFIMLCVCNLSSLGLSVRSLKRLLPKPGNGGCDDLRRFINLSPSRLYPEGEPQGGSGESFAPANCKQGSRGSGLSGMAPAAGRTSDPFPNERLQLG